MVEMLQILSGWSGCRDDGTMMSDDNCTLTRGDLAARVAGLAEELHDLPRVIGLLGSNRTDWAVAQLAAWAAGKTVVPLPSFFSPLQLEHVLRDAAIDHIVATRDAFWLAAALGVATTPVSDRRAGTIPTPIPGAGVIVYTSGSTGQPKGVWLRLEQIDWQAQALAKATEASEHDLHLSVLPLSLLLEMIAAVCVPVLAGARTHFASAVAQSVGAGRPADMLGEFERWRPTTTVLVPQLLSAWVAQLEARSKRPPQGLRFVAVGGAPVSEALAERAWELGIPVHEGYGLTECCSVVAVNRPGRRKARTVGEPLPGLDVRIEQGEVVVNGPTVMEGYLSTGAAKQPWRTGDLGALDQDGFLRVTGRKDNLLVTASGRNVSPEWVEAMLMGDPRVGACAVLGHGRPRLNVLLIPSPSGERWLTESPRAHVLLWLEQVCVELPAYAVPKDFVVCGATEAKRIGLLTSNGHIVRETAKKAYPALKAARCLAAARASSMQPASKGETPCCFTIG
jgi:long-subunit acyl-CoA synthetase (AMP-forming)